MKYEPCTLFVFTHLPEIVKMVIEKLYHNFIYFYVLLMVLEVILELTILVIA